MITTAVSPVQSSNTMPAPISSSQSSLPLSLAAPGETVLIQQIRGGNVLRQRLFDLGLHQGASICIVKNEMPAPLIIAVKGDGRLALGRDICQKIMVILVTKSNQSGAA
jgi:Fe2+ transport system protein FeoA